MICKSLQRLVLPVAVAATLLGVGGVAAASPSKKSNEVAYEEARAVALTEAADQFHRKSARSELEARAAFTLARRRLNEAEIDAAEGKLGLTVTRLLEAESAVVQAGTDIRAARVDAQHEKRAERIAARLERRAERTIADGDRLAKARSEWRAARSELALAADERWLAEECKLEAIRGVEAGNVAKTVRAMTEATQAASIAEQLRRDAAHEREAARALQHGE